MKQLSTLHEIFQNIISSTFFKFGANGDKQIFASLSRLIALSYQFDSANYALKQAENLIKLGKEEILVLYQLHNCIISYAACYDTLLQVVYFAFSFCDRLNNEKDLFRAQENLRWHNDSQSRYFSLKKKLEETSSDKPMLDFIAKIDRFMGKTRQQVVSLANHMKHGGGLITDKYANYLPHMGFVNEPITFVKSKDNTIHLENSGNITSFTAAVLYPYIIDLKKVIQQMRQQNEKIFQTVQYVYSTLKFDKMDVLCNPLKDKYINPLSHGTEQDK